MAKSDFDEESGAMFENNDDGLLINLEGVEAQKFEALPKGTYNAIIEDNEFQMSKSSGKPMWNLKLAITDEEYKNRKLFTFLSWSEKALPGTKAALATFAPELTSGNISVKDPETVQSIVGRTVRVQVSVEKYQDNDQNRIKKWMVPEGGGDFIN